MSKRAIYKFRGDFGRMGSLRGVFTAMPEEVADVVGRDLRFGEALGKHSNVCGIMEATDFAFVSDDDALVELFDKHGLATGANPVNVAASNAEEDAENARYAAKRAAT